MQKLWPDTFVEELTLTRNIADVRKALGAGGQRYIETVPKRGYRFVAEVRELPNELVVRAAEASTSPEARQEFTDELIPAAGQGQAAAGGPAVDAIRRRALAPADGKPITNLKEVT